jgi:predicted permease
VLGRRLRINGYEFTIVGVAPKSFTGMDQYLQPALYVPVHTASLAMPNAPAGMLDDRGNQWLNCIGRLASGASIDTAKAEFSALGARLAQAYPKTNENRSLVIEKELKARFHRDSLDGMLALTLVGIAGLVLLIACANLANLMLARGVARAREVAIRLSIGAGRGRLVRQLLTESIVLASIGGAAGLVVAYWSIRALASIKLPTDMPIVLAVQMDQRVILFSIAATLVTGILFGLAPAIRASRTDLTGCLRAGAQPPPARKGRVSLRNVLVVAQVSVALAVLTSAGLLIQSFIASQHLRVGFRTNGILMMSLDPSLVRVTRAQGMKFYEQLTDRAGALPGVERAALTRNVPLGFSGSSTGIVVDGYEMAKDQTNVQIDSDTVGLNYFETLNISLLRGRSFDQRDAASAPRVAIVNETMARRFWPNGDALGSRFRLDNRGGAEVTVIGIAKDVTYRSTYEHLRPHLYLPFAQDYQARNTLLVLAKPGNDPAQLASAVRNEVRSLNADVPIFDIRSFRQFYDDRVLMPPRLLGNIVSALGVVGLALAVIGLYGVISYTVSRRTKELGIRMAIGAERAQVARMVLREGLTLSLTGIAIGLPLAFLLSRAMSALTVERTGRAEPILIAVTCVLVLVSVLAAWIPARRAAKIDPMVALRYE